MTTARIAAPTRSYCLLSHTLPVSSVRRRQQERLYTALRARVHGVVLGETASITFGVGATTTGVFGFGGVTGGGTVTGTTGGGGTVFVTTFLWSTFKISG